MPGEILRRHVEAFERGDLVELIEQLAAGGVGDAAPNEGDGDPAFALGDRLDLVEPVGRIEDRRPRLALDAEIARAEQDAERAAFIGVGLAEKDLKSTRLNSSH